MFSFLQRQPITYSDDRCPICHEPLIVPCSNDHPDYPSYMIDDVELSCNHHFHKSCIFEYAAISADAREHCALCRTKVSNSDGNFRVKCRTENGHITWWDLGRDIEERAYFRAHPEEKRAAMFLDAMFGMNFDKAEKFLKGEDELGNGRPLDPNVACQDVGRTAMHTAVFDDEAESIRFLLRYGADKEVKDKEGKTALDIARAVNTQAVIALLSGEQS